MMTLTMTTIRIMIIIVIIYIEISYTAFNHTSFKLFTNTIVIYYSKY